RRLPTILTQDHLSSLIQAADEETPQGLRNRAILELMYAAGVRLSEVVGLDLRNLDLGERALLVRGKGNKERMVLIGAPAERALRRYLREARPKLTVDDLPALFLNRGGQRLSGRSVQQIVRSHALRAGLDERVHPHLLRHSFATHLLDGGAELRVVQELLGHASASTTQIYTHVTEEQARRVYTQAFYNQVRLNASKDEDSDKKQKYRQKARTRVETPRRRVSDHRRAGNVRQCKRPQDLVPKKPNRPNLSWRRCSASSRPILGRNPSLNPSSKYSSLTAQISTS